MQIVSTGGNLHQMSNFFSGKKKSEKNIINVSSAELAEIMETVKVS